MFSLLLLFFPLVWFTSPVCEANLTQNNVKELNELRNLLKSLPNVTPNLRLNWDPRPKNVSFGKYQQDLDHYSDCQGLFLKHNGVIRNLEKYVYEAKNSISEPPIDLPKHLLFLRSFSVSEHQKQDIFYNPDIKKIMINLNKLHLMDLDSFINWIKIQVEIVDYMMNLQNSMIDVFNIRYKDFLPTETNVYISDDVETFNPDMMKLHRVH